MAIFMSTYTGNKCYVIASICRDKCNFHTSFPTMTKWPVARACIWPYLVIPLRLYMLLYFAFKGDLADFLMRQYPKFSSNVFFYLVEETHLILHWIASHIGLFVYVLWLVIVIIHIQIVQYDYHNMNIIITCITISVCMHECALECEVYFTYTFKTHLTVLNLMTLI